MKKRCCSLIFQGENQLFPIAKARPFSWFIASSVAASAWRTWADRAIEIDTNGAIHTRNTARQMKNGAKHPQPIPGVCVVAEEAPRHKPLGIVRGDLDGVDQVAPVGLHRGAQVLAVSLLNATLLQLSRRCPGLDSLVKPLISRRKARGQLHTLAVLRTSHR